MARIRWPVILAFLIAILLLWISVNWAAEADSAGSALALATAMLFPVGLTLIAWSALPADRAESAAGLATLALALALIGYLVSGFGFHFGGVASVSDNEGLQNLSRFFSVLRGDNSASWGFAGLEGFFLSGDASTPAALQLFVSQLPLVASIALIVMLGLPRQTPPLAQVLVGLIISAVTFPLAGHWVNGGGWLTHLGDTLGMGHGLVDFGGAGTVFVVGGATLLAAAPAFGQAPAPTSTDRKAPLPFTRFPILSALGALLAAVGWIGVMLANPLYIETSDVLNWPLIVLNSLAGLAGATVVAQLYSWLTIGRFDPSMGSRGSLAGLIAASAGAPFLPTWAALIIGSVAGLLLPLATYAIDRFLRFEDTSAAIASYTLPGAWGLLAVAVFADGRWGQGWNGVSGLDGQGVSGLVVAPGLQADGGQLGAQVWGAIALFTLGFLLPWGIFKLVKGLSSLVFSRKTQTAPVDDALGINSTPASQDQSASGPLDGVADVYEGG